MLKYLLINNINIAVEIADTPEKQWLGLQFRKQLPENQGMLFLFDKVQNKTFHTRNCLFPLDFICIINGTVKEIKTVQPEVNEVSCKDVDAILEMNGNWAKKNGIQVGMKFQNSKEKVKNDIISSVLSGIKK